MKSWPLILTLVAAIAAGLVLFAPLRAGLIWADAGRAGLSAREVHGTIWSGTLKEARLRGFPLGDIRAGLAPSSLFSGVARLSLRSDGGAAVLAGGRETGIERASLAIGLDRIGLAIANPGAVTLSAVTVLFSDGACKAAGGTLSTDVLQRSWSGPVVSGPFRCEGRAAVARLTGAAPNATAGAVLAIQADGVYRLESQVVTGDPALQSAIVLSGFQRGPNGLTRVDAGRLGG